MLLSELRKGNPPYFLTPLPLVSMMTTSSRMRTLVSLSSFLEESPY